MATLKEKTISGLTWSFTDNLFNVVIQAIIGIILARLLSPEEFGLIGMTAIFIAISQLFIDSGFSSSLIRKKNCSQNDYSTIFYFNLAAGIIFYLILFILAKPISAFFNEPRLVCIIRVIGVGLVITSFNIIQQVILVKRVDFKLQTKISVISSAISGLIGICMAYSGFGVWSLVWKSISAYFLSAVLFWTWINWCPVKIFNLIAFKEHFKFGYKLLLSNLINVLYTNIFYLTIGKFFSAAKLGYYTKAEQFSSLSSSNLTLVVNRVSYPVLSELVDDPVKLKKGYKKIIKSTMFISFVLMIGLAAVAKPLIITLIGEKWSVSISYLQLLCFSAMFYPLHALNLNILNVKGRTDLSLKIEIIKKLLVIPIILVAISFGIKAMLIGLIVISTAAYFLNGYWSAKMINYPIGEQIADIFPSLILAIAMGVLVYLSGYLIHFNPLYLLLFQVSLGATITFGFSELFKISSYLDIKEIITARLFQFKKG